MRGYRRGAVHRAALNEAAAGGLVTLASAGAPSGDLGPLTVDPMCGSGTLLVEAALRAARVAPGLLRPPRSFACTGWGDFDAGAWARAEDTRIEVDENDVIIRGPRGLHAIERGLFAPLPADSLVLDDGSIVTLKAVDADRPAPRHKRSRDGGSVVAPCALVGIRGLPPVERHLEASLCHDRGIERTARDKIGNKRRSAVHSNMVLLDGGDIIIAASRGVVRGCCVLARGSGRCRCRAQVAM